MLALLRGVPLFTLVPAVVFQPTRLACVAWYPSSLLWIHLVCLLDSPPCLPLRLGISFSAESSFVGMFLILGVPAILTVMSCLCFCCLPVSTSGVVCLASPSRKPSLADLKPPPPEQGVQPPDRKARCWAHRTPTRRTFRQT